MLIFVLLDLENKSKGDKVEVMKIDQRELLGIRVMIVETEVNDWRFILEGTRQGLVKVWCGRSGQHQPTPHFLQ